MRLPRRLGEVVVIVTAAGDSDSISGPNSSWTGPAFGHALDPNPNLQDQGIPFLNHGVLNPLFHRCLTVTVTFTSLLKVDDTVEIPYSVR